MKTKFVWELKETSELLKLAEARGPADTITHARTRTWQSNIKSTGWRVHNPHTRRALAAHAEQSWWISLFAAADGRPQPLKRPAVCCYYCRAQQQGRKEENRPSCPLHRICSVQLQTNSTALSVCLSDLLENTRNWFWVSIFLLSFKYQELHSQDKLIDSRRRY